MNGRSLNWSVETTDRSTVVHLHGEIDLATEDEFADAARAGLAENSPVVILDLTKVTFLGSVGLRVLVLAHREAADAGLVLQVVEGSPIVHRILEVSGLDQLLSVHPTLDDANRAASAD
ncbi:STAS domain-containing protein [Kibdelosporangium persicum]|uniref:Anti-sigma factor antagonist n=1 Tax=Kibdelosporangium persicum TaxID=2698649 RepID=A0ABX2FHC4_9PSEU|nr:STAS domain-containing protein [Kibdelosporangium persicum]NRN70808.1 Anti-sigma B factor antagonist [Kibdelosporangium persicum]